MPVKPEEVNETLKESKPITPKEEKELAQKEKEEAILTVDRLGNYANVGMSKVDPLDILPPQILLVQKISDLSMMQDKNGKTPKVGQFFHTGKKEIYDTFEAYIIFAGKSQFTDRRKTLPDGSHPVMDQYKVIGALKDDLSMFGMSFRSTAFYALSGLFTATKSQKLPMFSFNILVENKLITGQKGEWYVPVLRVGKTEEKPEVLKSLLSMAMQFERKAENIVAEDEEENQGGPPF